MVSIRRDGQTGKGNLQKTYVPVQLVSEEKESESERVRERGYGIDDEDYSRLMSRIRWREKSNDRFGIRGFLTAGRT